MLLIRYHQQDINEICEIWDPQQTASFFLTIGNYAPYLHIVPLRGEKSHNNKNVLA